VRFVATRPAAGAAAVAEFLRCGPVLIGRPVHLGESMHTKSKFRLAAAALALPAAGMAQAADFVALGTLSQSEFRAFSEDMGSVLSYKPMIPAEGLGITGFDLGISVSGSDLAHRDIARKAANGESVAKTMPTTAVRAVKGLPFDIDIGVTAATLPGSGLRAVGGELRWAFLGGSVVLPSVALRLSTMTLTTTDQLKLRTNMADLSISKGVAFLTPYAGVGYVDVRSQASNTLLQREKFGLTKVFGGVNIALVPLALVLEVEKTGDVSTYGAKIAIRW
jgi:hypothetical protein